MAELSSVLCLVKLSWTTHSKAYWGRSLQLRRIPSARARWKRGSSWENSMTPLTSGTKWKGQAQSQPVTRKQWCSFRLTWAGSRLRTGKSDEKSQISREWPGECWSVLKNCSELPRMRKVWGIQFCSTNASNNICGQTQSTWGDSCPGLERS